MANSMRNSYGWILDRLKEEFGNIEHRMEDYGNILAILINNKHEIKIGQNIRHLNRKDAQKKLEEMITNIKQGEEK